MNSRPRVDYELMLYYVVCCVVSRWFIISPVCVPVGLPVPSVPIYLLPRGLHVGMHHRSEGRT